MNPKPEKSCIAFAATRFVAYKRFFSCVKRVVGFEVAKCYEGFSAIRKGTFERSFSGLYKVIDT